MEAMAAVAPNTAPGAGDRTDDRASSEIDGSSPRRWPKNTALRYQTVREVAAAATAALDEAAFEVRTESTIPEADSAKPAPPTVC
jgi:hypothetical protein